MSGSTCLIIDVTSIVTDSQFFIVEVELREQNQHSSHENRQKAYFGKISRKNFRILVDLHKNSNLPAMTLSLKMAIRKAIFQKHLKTYLLLNPWNWFDLFENFNDVVSVSKVDREMFTIFRPQLVAKAGPHWSVANSWPAARSRVVL